MPFRFPFSKNRAGGKSAKRGSLQRVRDKFRKPKILLKSGEKLKDIVADCILKEIQGFEAEKGHKPKSEREKDLIELLARRRTQTRLIREVGLGDEALKLAKSSFIQRDVLFRAMKTKGLAYESVHLALDIFVKQLDFIENKLANRLSTKELSEFQISIPKSDFEKTRQVASELQSKLQEFMGEEAKEGLYGEGGFTIGRQKSNVILETNEAVLGILFGGRDKLAFFERTVTDSMKIFNKKIRKI